jgi:hypothetical protein
MEFSSVVIVHDLDMARARTARGPDETNAPLVIDANAALAPAVALQRLQTVTGKAPQRLRIRRGVEPIQTHLGLMAKAIKGFHPLACGEVPGAPVPIAQNHGNE